jgi:hypothetical protein
VRRGFYGFESQNYSFWDVTPCRFVSGMNILERRPSLHSSILKTGRAGSPKTLDYVS